MRRALAARDQARAGCRTTTERASPPPRPANAVWLLRKRSSGPAERRADNPGLYGGETDSASPALLHGTFERRAFPPACHPHWMAPSTVTPPQGVAWPPARTGGFQSPPRLTSRAWPKENCSTGGPHRLRPPRHAEPRPNQVSGPRPGTPWKAMVGMIGEMTEGWIGFF